MWTYIKWVLFIIAIQTTHNPLIAGVVLIAFYLIQLSTEENKEVEDDSDNKYSRYVNQGRIRNNIDNADIGLIYLAAYIIQIDPIAPEKQVDYIRRFLLKNFDTYHVNQRLTLLNRLLEKNISYEDGCRRVMYFYQIEDRIKVIDFLFNVAQADGTISSFEVLAIKRIAYALFVNINDFELLKNKYYKTDEHEKSYQKYSNSHSSYMSIEIHFAVLEIKLNSTPDEIKSAYRKKVLTFHPDKWIQASLQEQEQAKKKFIEVQEAFDKIREHKGFK
jgi:DnaJ like chaperone protein